MIKIFFFASIREQVGCPSLELGLPKAVTICELMAVLSTELAERGGFLTDPRLLIAVNQQMVGLDAPVSDGDEVAFFPPVTGG